MKNKKTVKKNKNQKGRFLLSMLATLVLGVILSFNVYYSQAISPLYFQLIDDNKEAAINFLKRIKNIPEFKTEFIKYTDLYGSKIKERVFEDEKKRRETIKQLEQVLEKNPKARDILYGLYLLYQAEGDEKKAEDYFNRAKTIDPMIK